MGRFGEAFGTHSGSDERQFALPRPLLLFSLHELVAEHDNVVASLGHLLEVTRHPAVPPLPVLCVLWEATAVLGTNEGAVEVVHDNRDRVLGRLRGRRKRVEVVVVDHGGRRGVVKRARCGWWRRGACLAHCEDGCHWM